MDLPIRTDVESFVIVGVDTHADAHVAVALDGLGVGASATRPCPQRRPATPHTAGLVAGIRDAGPCRHRRQRQLRRGTEPLPARKGCRGL
jgi:hypothetical protein